MTDCVPMELLHERLEGYVKDDCGLDILFHDFAAGSTAELLTALVKEIEQYYVPVPRYESGDPIREGDETERGTVSRIEVYATWGNWGDWLVGFEEGDVYEGTLSQRMKRFSITHERPDSLELIEEEASWGIEVYAHDIIGMTCDELSCMDRNEISHLVTNDLLRRQRKLLERS